MEFHRALCWDQCFLPHILHHSALLYLVSTYADDTQMYISLSVLSAKESLEKLQQWLMGVSTWMTGCKLKLNSSKTEFLLIGTKFQREKILPNFPCVILGQDTNPSASAKNLGVVFDSSLNFRKHISQTCSTCFYHIRDLRRI